MPYPGIPPSKTRAMERCVKDVMSQGHDKSSAIGICHNSIMGNKKVDMNKAVWSTAYVNSLPDSSFAYISSGGKKDKDGKTTPRSLRHLPYKDANGKIDPAHVRNALARLNQTNIPASAKASAKTKLIAAAKQVGITVNNKVNSEGGENKMAKKTTVTIEEDEAKKGDEAEVVEEKEVKEEEAVKESEEVAEEANEEEATSEEEVDSEEAKSETEENEETEANEEEKADNISNLLKSVLDKLDEMQTSLKKQDGEEDSASAEGAASEKEEEAPEGGEEEAPVEDKASEDASPEGAEKMEKVATDLTKISDQLSKFEKTVTEKMEGLAERVNKLEEQPAPSKVTSSHVVTKVNVEKAQSRIDEINKELEDLEELKRVDLEKFQKERKWEKAFDLIAERRSLQA